MNAVTDSDLSLVNSNYHDQKEPYGVNLASGEAKIRHYSADKNMAAKFMKNWEQVHQEF